MIDVLLYMHFPRYLEDYGHPYAHPMLSSALFLNHTYTTWVIDESDNPSKI